MKEYAVSYTCVDTIIVSIVCTDDIERSITELKESKSVTNLNYSSDKDVVSKLKGKFK